jgi:hypothetical protein
MSNTAQTTDAISAIAEQVPDEVVQVVDAAASVVDKVVAEVQPVVTEVQPVVTEVQQVVETVKKEVVAAQSRGVERWLFWAATGFGAWLVLSGLRDMMSSRNEDGRNEDEGDR